MYNVQTEKSKLYRKNKRVPFHKNELYIDMLHELIDLCCFQQGSLIDLYSVSMTTALASMCTGRKFVSIEKDNDCFDESFG